MNPLFEIVTLKTGIKSLRSLVHGETFHPGTGPLEEARILHVEQQKLVERACSLPRLVIWDVGFGAAANAIAAIEALTALGNVPSEIELHSFDQSTAPIEFALAHAETLGYMAPHQIAIEQLLFRKEVHLRKNFKWLLHLGDFRIEFLKSSLPSPHCIFYDPYSPTGNHEMWTLEHFSRLYGRLDPAVPCLLTNYTRSTSVRVTWLMAGFYVGVGCIIGEKIETTVASNTMELIEVPLKSSWLERVKISRNGAPISGSQYLVQPIVQSDFERLKRLSQF